MPPTTTPVPPSKVMKSMILSFMVSTVDMLFTPSKKFNFSAFLKVPNVEGVVKAFMREIMLSNGW